MAMRRLTPSLALGLAAGLASACAYSNVKRDLDRQPIVHTGVGATILMPGQSAPALQIPGRGLGQPGSSPGYGAPPSGATSGSYSGSGMGSGSGSGAAPGAAQGYSGGSYGAPAGAPGAPGGSNIHFIGGADIDEVRHTEMHQDPLLLKGLFAPVALVAWPFRKAYEVLQGDPEPVVAPPPAAAPRRGPVDYEGAYEQSQLDQLEQQVARPAPPAIASAPPGSSPGGAQAAARPSSIADELATLQRRVQPRGVAAESASGAAPGAATPSGVADKVSDRNGDGRPDVWQYRSQGVLVRELFDEDGDGRVDRTLRYDPASGEKTYEEEDSNVDGLVDSWVEYRGGQVVRRRQDGNADGEPDSWTLYRAGKLARVEEDRNGDGFRDRVGYYQDGRMRREVEDANGDGRPDRVTLYDDTERARERSEDLDGDGLVDARSFFENGKLVRRELVDESLSAQPLVEEEQLGTPEGFSDGSEGGAAPEAGAGEEG